MNKFFKYIFIFSFVSIPLKAELTFDDYMDFSSTYNSSSNVNSLSQSSNNKVDLRFDNRVVANYNYSSFFKSEFHLLTSVSNKGADGFQIPIDLVIEDDRYSLLRLTNTQSQDGRTIINKIDRLNFSFYTDNFNLTVGRSAVTWSRGRIFHVTDFFNPSNPGFYDAQYKLGTDIISLDYSLDNKNSISIVANPKRNHLTEDVTLEDTNFGARYLYSNDSLDASIIVGQYLRDYAMGGGFSTGFLFSSVLRTDVMVYKPEFDRDKNKMMAMLGLEKSFNFADKFTTIFTEYYHNDLGTNKEGMSGISALNSSMIRRLAERDTYLVSKDYLALGVSMEVTNYLSINYSNTISLKDGSSFNFIGAGYNYSDKIDLGISIGMPYGANNKEFGATCGTDGTCYGMGTLALFSLSYAV